MQVHSYEDAMRVSKSQRAAGKGAFSRVITDDDDPGVVHKIGFRDDPAYRAYVENVALLNQHNPAAPRIYDYKTWPHRVRAPLDADPLALFRVPRPDAKDHYVRMEALQPISKAPLEVRRRAADLLVLTYDSVPVDRAVREYPHEWFTAAWRPLKTHAEIRSRVNKEQPNVAALLDQIEEVAKRNGYANDMHDKNMMWRPSTGDIVITDPLYD